MSPQLYDGLVLSGAFLSGGFLVVLAVADVALCLARDVAERLRRAAHWIDQEVVGLDGHRERDEPANECAGESAVSQTAETTVTGDRR